MNDVIDLNIWQLVPAYVFVLIVLLISRTRKLGREQEILVASIRMTAQLILTGFVLEMIFGNPHPVVTIAIIVLMECFAVYTIFDKFKGQLSKSLKSIIALAMAFGTISCLIYFLLIVVQISPWYDPRYFIPVAGMIVGNSMTGISLAVKSLLEGMTTQKQLVEEAMILGATPHLATKSILDSTFDAAIMPTINSMLGMGIVFLPGMMTGQILSGTAPTTAIMYQIAIMLGILGAVALTVMIMLRLGYRTFFNNEDQLVGVELLGK